MKKGENAGGVEKNVGGTRIAPSTFPLLPPSPLLTLPTLGTVLKTSCLTKPVASYAFCWASDRGTRRSGRLGRQAGRRRQDIGGEGREREGRESRACLSSLLVSAWAGAERRMRVWVCVRGRVLHEGARSPHALVREKNKVCRRSAGALHSCDDRGVASLAPCLRNAGAHTYTKWRPPPLQATPWRPPFCAPCTRRGPSRTRGRGRTRAAPPRPTSSARSSRWKPRTWSARRCVF
jgi:hypothetical protein